MKKKMLNTLITLGFVTTGCQTTDPYTGEKQTSKTTSGAVIGGVAGAILGNQVKGKKHTRRNARLAGSAIGALIGGKIGNNLDKKEQELREKLQNTGVSVERQGSQIKLNMPGQITFATNQSSLNPSFIPTLNSIAEVLKKYQDTNIDIAGHTDSIGTATANQILSEQRAASVGLALRRQGIVANRIMTQGFGESQPVDSNKTPLGRQNNRRVEIALTPTAH